jgi:hypothetical protein
MSMDAPDWERILVTVQSEGDVPDAPDWERIAVAPGGAPIGGGGGQSGPIASDFGWVGWSFPPWQVTAGANAVQGRGTTYLTPVKALSTTTVHGISYVVAAPSSAPTSGHSYVGLYSWSGTTPLLGTFTLLGATASGTVDASMETAGGYNELLASGVAVTAGDLYYCAFITGTANYVCESPYWFALGINYPNNSAPPPSAPMGGYYVGGTSTLPSTISAASIDFTPGNMLWMAMY